MQYRMILEVESVAEATAIGMMLERLGYEVVSGRIEPESFPTLKEVRPVETGPLVAAPAHDQEWQGGFVVVHR